MRGISRFNGSHKFAAYARVVPSVRNSADTIHHGRITKKGSMTLRWVMIKAAHSHIIHAPNSNITQFYNRIKKKRGSSKDIVATGSKMLRVILDVKREERICTKLVRAIGRVMNHEDEKSRLLTAVCLNSRMKIALRIKISYR